MCKECEVWGHRDEGSAVSDPADPEGRPVCHWPQGQAGSEVAQDAMVASIESYRGTGGSWGDVWAGLRERKE